MLGRDACFLGESGAATSPWCPGLPLHRIQTLCPTLPAPGQRSGLGCQSPALCLAEVICDNNLSLPSPKSHATGNCHAAIHRQHPPCMGTGCTGGQEQEDGQHRGKAAASTALAALPVHRAAPGKGEWMLTAHLWDTSLAWGYSSMRLYHSSPRCCSEQTPRPSTCWGTPGLPTAPGNGSAFIHPDDVPETTFLALFYFSTARNKRGTNPIGAGKGTNPDRRMLWYPTTAPAASPHQPACPSSSLSPTGVARPCHRSPRSVPGQHSQRCEMQTPGEGRDRR